MDLKTKRALLHLIYPNRCPICGSVIGAQDRFCTDCESRLTLYDDSFCPPEADSFTAVYVYNGSVKPAIKLLKNGICGNADYALGMALAEKLRRTDIISRCDMLVPVPMWKADIRKRRYNQSGLICRIISAELGIPVCVEAVSKVRPTAPQKLLDKQLRSINLTGAFIAVPELAAGKRIMMIDDICTTGSTISETASALRKAGAAEVHSASCCKTLPGKNK